MKIESPVNTPVAANDANGRAGHGLFKALYLCFRLLQFGVATLCLRLINFKLRLQIAVYRLQRRHLAFQKVNMLTENGRRSMFTDPFFNVREWVQVWHGTHPSRVNSNHNSK